MKNSRTVEEVDEIKSICLDQDQTRILNWSEENPSISPKLKTALILARHMNWPVTFDVVHSESCKFECEVPVHEHDYE